MKVGNLDAGFAFGRQEGREGPGGRQNGCRTGSRGGSGPLRNWMDMREGMQ